MLKNVIALGSLHEFYSVVRSRFLVKNTSFVLWVVLKGRIQNGFSEIKYFVFLPYLPSVHFSRFCCDLQYYCQCIFLQDYISFKAFDLQRLINTSAMINCYRTSTQSCLPQQIFVISVNIQGDLFLYKRTIN